MIGTPAPGDDGSGIVVSDVSFGYNGVPLLCGMSLRIRKGAVVSLLGPNGCGKTTLLKIINGTLRAAKGTVYVDGGDIAKTPYRQVSRLMGQVAQNHKSTFPFTVMDVVLTGRAPYVPVFSAPGAADTARCAEILEKLSVLHLAARPYTRISGGERQLVMIARALAQEPEFLLLDEPTTYLDLKNQIHILKTIVMLAHDRNITILMTLHDPNHAMMFSDTIVLMKKPSAPACAGETPGDMGGGANLISIGDPRDVITTENVKEAYGVEVDVVDHKGFRLVVPRP